MELFPRNIGSAYCTAVKLLNLLMKLAPEWLSSQHNPSHYSCNCIYNLKLDKNKYVGGDKMITTLVQFFHINMTVVLTWLNIDVWHFLDSWLPITICIMTFLLLQISSAWYVCLSATRIEYIFTKLCITIQGGVMRLFIETKLKSIWFMVLLTH